MAIKGNDIFIMRNGYAIAGTRSNEFQTKAETIEKASATQQDWQEFVAGRKGWNITSSWLMLAAGEYSKTTDTPGVTAVSNGIRGLLEVSNEVTIVIRDRAGSNMLRGTAICTQCKITASRGNLVSGSFSFLGTGPLETFNR